jgi:hypothetical protein
MNESVESFHGTIGTILCHYEQERDEDWDDHLPCALFAYHAKIMTSPFQLLYGRQPQSEVNVKFQAKIIKGKDSRAAAQRIDWAILIGDKLGDLREYPNLEKITSGIKILIKRSDRKKDIRLTRWLVPYKVTSVRKESVFYKDHNRRANSAHKGHIKTH